MPDVDQATLDEIAHLRLAVPQAAYQAGRLRALGPDRSEEAAEAESLCKELEAKLVEKVQAAGLAPPPELPEDDQPA